MTGFAGKELSGINCARRDRQPAAGENRAGHGGDEGAEAEGSRAGRRRRERENLEDVAMRAVAARRARTGVADSSERAASEADRLTRLRRQLAFGEPGTIRRDPSRDQMDDGPGQRRIRILHDEHEFGRPERHVRPGERRRDVLAGAGIGAPSAKAELARTMLAGTLSSRGSFHTRWRSPTRTDRSNRPIACSIDMVGPPQRRLAAMLQNSRFRTRKKGRRRNAPGAPAADLARAPSSMPPR
jgi:hypothetical protein